MKILAFGLLVATMVVAHVVGNEAGLRAHVSSALLEAEAAEDAYDDMLAIYQYENKKQKMEAKRSFLKALKNFNSSMIPEVMNAMQNNFAGLCPPAKFDVAPIARKMLPILLRAVNLKPKILGEQLEMREKVLECRIRTVVDLLQLDSLKMTRKQQRKLKISLVVLMLPTEMEVYSTDKVRSKMVFFDKTEGGPPVVKVPDVPPSKEKKYVNYVEQGFTNLAASQSPCGNCYAQASYQVLSGRCFLDTNRLYELSVMEYLTCKAPQRIQPDKTVCDNDGGVASTVNEIFTFFEQRPSPTFEEFPYNGVELRKLPAQVMTECPMNRTFGAPCKMKQSQDCQGMVASPTNNQMMQILDKYGPSLIWIKAGDGTLTGGDGVDFGSLGIPNLVIPEKGFFKIDHDKVTTDHAVTLVGYYYDPDSVAKSFWIIKNSWGPDWAYGGYFFVSMNGPYKASSKSPGVLGVNDSIFFLKPGCMSLNNPNVPETPEDRRLDPFDDGLDVFYV